MKNFLNYAKRKHLSLNTLKTYESSLKQMNVESNEWEVIKNNLFSPKFSNNTIHLHANVLKNYFKFKENKLFLKKLNLLKLPPIEVKYYLVLSKNIIYKKTEIHEKDNDLIKKWKIIIRFLFETGIRASELNNINLINRKMFVIGKGSKKRQIFYLEETVSNLKKYLPNLNHKSTSKTLRIYVKKILGNKITPHSLRRSFATHMLKNNANPKSLMLQMGHSKIETTFRYLNLSEKYNHSNYLKTIKK